MVPGRNDQIATGLAVTGSDYLLENAGVAEDDRADDGANRLPAFRFDRVGQPDDRRAKEFANGGFADIGPPFRERGNHVVAVGIGNADAVFRIRKAGQGLAIVVRNTQAAVEGANMLGMADKVILQAFR
ncbi:hypothetical protein SDC9_181557 [bioreactor metagenome]|uniref:Uncharacterized protein n=1 Tax=bioreactor metagenome TaxID=1076179 RepID=A0A645H4Z0_9ZZZZ